MLGKTANALVGEGMRAERSDTNSKPPLLRSERSTTCEASVPAVE